MIDKNKLISLIDLTSLNSTDSEKSISSFINKANQSVNGYYPASVCTYPKYAHILKSQLISEIKSCTVSTYFPSSQAPLILKCQEIDYLNTIGIDEIDNVLPIGEFLDKNYTYVYNELHTIRKSTTKVIKLIIESGTLKSTALISKATQIGIETDMDFIKTSTGKANSGADLNAVIAIAKTIRMNQPKLEKTVGIKVAGGLKTIAEANSYIKAVEMILGQHFIAPATFRIGASSLYDTIINH